MALAEFTKEYMIRLHLQVKRRRQAKELLDSSAYLTMVIRNQSESTLALNEVDQDFHW